MTNFGPPYEESLRRAKRLKQSPCVIDSQGKYEMHFPGHTGPVKGYLVGDGNPCLYLSVNNIARWIDSLDNSVKWLCSCEIDGRLQIDSCQHFTDLWEAEVAAVANKSWIMQVVEKKACVWHDIQM